MKQSQFWIAVKPYLAEALPPEAWVEMAGRRRMSFRLYQDRDKDSNPYYASNAVLGRVVQALISLVTSLGPYPCRGACLQALKNLYQLTHESEADSSQMMKSLRQAQDEQVCDFINFACYHLIEIDRLAGGHRSPLLHDMEIDITVIPMTDYPDQAVEDLVRQSCEANHIGYVRLDRHAS